jgi:hypothetical protein
VDGRDEMEKFYKNHRIEVSLSLEDEGWFVSLFIYYNDKDTNILVTFSLDKKFATYDGAVETGLSAAQEWIDRGKPVHQ